MVYYLGIKPYLFKHSCETLKNIRRRFDFSNTKSPFCRLHMLNELEQCFLTLIDFPSSSTRGQQGATVGDTTAAMQEPAIEFGPLMQQWNSRLKFSQVLMSCAKKNKFQKSEITMEVGGWVGGWWVHVSL